MFTIYYSNLLETQKDILLRLMEISPLDDPFQQETILVQSPGMEQWVSWQMAEQAGISANVKYPMPASFIWQLYVDNLPNVEAQSHFKKENLLWRIMKHLPHFLAVESFLPLRHYLQHKNSGQLKLYQLAYKIADLFDQYLVYRPEWLQLWEENNEEALLQLLQNEKNAPFLEQIHQDIRWQGQLWRALIEDIQQETGQVQHRASLHHQFLTLLATQKPKNLPERIFIFGLSSLPKSHLDTFQALSRYCDVHLFFTNGCQEYWGDVMDPRHCQRLQLQQRLHYQSQEKTAWITEEQSQDFTTNHQPTSFNEALPVGNPLLATWGKTGRDFLYLLTESVNTMATPGQEISAYVENSCETLSLLQQVHQQILNFSPSQKGSLTLTDKDRSLTLHNCYSAMREVEVLQDYLLHLLQDNPDLTPKDIVVMVADIDKYTPYIQAVFGQSSPYLPFAIADNKITETDTFIASFLQLLQVNNSQFSAEEILALLDIAPIRERFEIAPSDLDQLHQWVRHSGVRFGLNKETDNHQQQALKNYNAWLAGLNRMLLGFSLREENGIWQDSLGLDETTGLQSQLVGKLADFLHALWAWSQFLQSSHVIEEWKEALEQMITRFFDEDQQSPIWQHLFKNIERLAENVVKGQFDGEIESEVIHLGLQEYLQDTPNRYRFTLGKINFCTLLPMRSIPFKVVCLLGMNDGEFPRQQVPNSFDLMQFHHKKGDRFRRDDDRYLFLEALLSAQQYFYVSFVGKSIKDDTDKEPSILVNQLKEYLAENLQDTQTPWLFQHPINAFSKHNYLGGYPSFAKKWLPQAQGKLIEPVKNFSQPVSKQEEMTEIPLENLVKFITHPVQDFFERRLGVFYRQYDSNIADCENFHLNTLQHYQLFEHLMTMPLENFNEEWHKQSVKGELPRGAFAMLEAEQMQKTLENFRERLKKYQGNSKSQTLNLQLVFGEKKTATVFGNILHFFPEQRQVLTYRNGTVKGKDYVQSYLTALVLACAKIEASVIHLGKDKDFILPPLDEIQARSVLTQMLEGYFNANQQLFMLPNEKLEQWIEQLGTEKAQENLEKAVNNLINGEKHYPSGNLTPCPYWQRLSQQQKFDFTAMHDTLQAWFSLLQAQLPKNEKSPKGKK